MPPARGGRGAAAANKKQNRYRRVRRKVCAFCAEHTDDIDYKMHQRLRRFVTDRGKIIPRRTTGTCAGHQRLLAHAIKRAREIALLPFTAE